MFLVKDVNKITWDGYYDRTTYSYKIPRTLNDVLTIKPYGSVYFGTDKEIQDIINSKLNKNSPSTFKKVYFDCKCKYPRYKLTEYTDIKRCLNPSKADSCIITKEARYGCMLSCYLIYSKSTNTYWMMCEPIRLQYGHSQVNAAVEYILNKLNYKRDSQDTLRVLRQTNVIPQDACIIYTGPYKDLTDNEYEHFDNIINKFMQITYDTELDKFVSANSAFLSIDDLNTIDGMLQSTDASVVAMGMKLLSNYNISNSVCAVTALICKNIHNIRTNTAKTSVGFKQILQQLNISSLNSYEYEMVNNAYKVATDASDRQSAHQIVCSKIKQDLEEFYKTLIRKYSNMEFSIDINIS